MMSRGNLVMSDGNIEIQIITPFTHRGPFTLRDGNARQVHLPFRLESTHQVHLLFKMEVPIESCVHPERSPLK